ncbi:hypothetical protein BZA77DRAFT_368158 [Pyronema omphalodes]|nr:hypothetical protein BZA77DRAFT_368158 [Pyronema omphalodes]
MPVDFDSLLASLPPPPFTNHPPRDPALSNKITDLRVHPAIESALHILNSDLASAHFLLRHMQSPPAYEGMYLHGILHRIEGDIPNAKAWYGDVKDSEVFKKVWGEGDAWQEFLDKIEGMRRGEYKEEELKDRGEEEIRVVLDYCKERFGTEAMEDASGCWVRPSEKIQKAGQGQITGDQQRGMF